MSGLKLIAPYFRRHFKSVALGFAALMGCDLAQLFIPGLLGQGVDLMSAEGAGPGALWRPVSRILLLAAAVAALRFVWRNLIIGFARRAELGLRDRLYEKLIRLSPRWHLENASGDLMAMATNDMDSIRMALSTGLISIVDTLLLGCTSLFFMVAISPALTLWAVLPLPAITLITHFLGRRLYLLVLEAQNSFGLLTETVREKLTGLKIIRAMGLTGLAMAETERAGRDYLRVNVRQAFLAGAFFPSLHFLSNLALALVIYFGGRETILGRVSTGDFVAFMSFLAILSWPLIALGLIIGLLQQGLASLDRLNRVFLAEEEAVGAYPPPPPAGTPLDIEISGLTFTYPTRRAPALSGLSLTLAHDRVTALVGPMGGGKSTLAALLPALFAAPPGAVRVAGRPVENWAPHDLRARFGYVPQDGFIFSGTLYENVAFGRPSAAEAEVLAAAETAGLGEDLSLWPDGLQTLVGERGLTLSGGQKQRLALARALLIAPPYLIMDDTLSAVDAEVEAAIMARLLKTRRGLGGLIISHRLSSLMEVDWVVVLDRGRVADQGAPADLMTREGYFKRVRELSQFEE